LTKYIAGNGTSLGGVIVDGEILIGAVGNSLNLEPSTATMD
jgi:O-acetylhomoserine/O-acetylserine sulfhydrylase-like pyridoxal-dependent enzyme